MSELSKKRDVIVYVTALVLIWPCVLGRHVGMFSGLKSFGMEWSPVTRCLHLVQQKKTL